MDILYISISTVGIWFGAPMIMAGLQFRHSNHEAPYLFFKLEGRLEVIVTYTSVAVRKGDKGRPPVYWRVYEKHWEIPRWLRGKRQ